MKKQLSRRKILKLLGSSGLSISAMAGGDPVLKDILTKLLDTCISSAHAQSAVPSRGLLSLFFEGGIINWVCFNSLKKNNNDPFVPNQAIMNYLNFPIQLDSRGIPKYEGEYRTYPITVQGKTMRMPTMWAHWTLPTANGGFTDFKNLANNMMICHYSNPDFLRDAHEQNQARAFSGVIGNNTIHGMIDEKNKEASGHARAPLLGTVSIGELHAYKAPSGMSPMIIDRNANNYAEKILEAFVPSSNINQYHTNNTQAQNKVNDLLDAFKNAGGGSTNPDANTYDLHHKAVRLFKFNVQNIINEYQTAVNKYTQLIHRSIRNARNDNLFGLMQGPMPGMPQTSVTSQGNKQKRGKRVNEVDVWFSRLHDGGRFMANNDLRDMFNLADMPRFAKQMASAEILARGIQIPGSNARQPLCSSINLKVEGISGIKALRSDYSEGTYDNVTNTTRFQFNGAENTNDYSVGYDAHSGGGFMQFLMLSLQYRAMGACLFELMNVLRATTYSEGVNAFTHWVIAMISEMGRQADMTHTEHNGAACTGVLFNGDLTFGAYGNCYDSDGNPNSVWPGSDGRSAPMQTTNGDPLLEGRMFETANFLNTIATLLKIDPITTNNPSIVEYSASGNLVYKLVPSRNIVHPNSMAVHFTNTKVKKAA